MIMPHCKALFVFLLSLFLCGLGYLDGATITGMVTDAEHKGFEAVLLRSGKHKSLSDKDGNFSIELMDSLHISRLGYKSQVLSQTQVQQLYRPSKMLIITMESDSSIWIGLSSYNGGQRRRRWPVEEEQPAIRLPVIVH
jgi:hypothetical protein